MRPGGMQTQVKVPVQRRELRAQRGATALGEGKQVRVLGLEGRQWASGTSCGQEAVLWPKHEEAGSPHGGLWLPR